MASTACFMRSGIDGQRDRPALLALAAAERRQHRRVEDQAFDRPGAELEALDAIGVAEAVEASAPAAACAALASGAGGRWNTTRTSGP